jgi:hypothetical protein
VPLTKNNKGIAEEAVDVMGQRGVIFDKSCHKMDGPST